MHIAVVMSKQIPKFFKIYFAIRQVYYVINFSIDKFFGDATF